jgi:hypothetical protein
MAVKLVAAYFNDCAADAGITKLDVAGSNASTSPYLLAPRVFAERDCSQVIATRQVPNATAEDTIPLIPREASPACRLAASSPLHAGGAEVGPLLAVVS